MDQIEDPSERETRLAEVMGRLANGDGAAVFDLRTNFESELVTAVRSVAGKRGARLNRQEVDDLVTDLVVELARHASAWRADGGAPPWIWARHRVGAVVDRHIGQYATSLDLEGSRELADAPERAWAPGRDRAVAEMLDELAREHPVVELLVEAVEMVASRRDATLYFELSFQAASGDPSPANTVAQLFDMNPAAVRQQSSRVRRRLQALAADEPRYAPLAQLPLVA